jgi:hypothetical protein
MTISGHAQRRQLLAFESGGIDRFVARQMQLHVQQPAGQELGGGEPLVERRGALDALDQFGRDRLRRSGSAGEAVQQFGRRQPVLEQLRRQFDEIARNARAGQRRVLHVRRQPCMAWPNS